MKGYKGFNSDLKCRDKQYEVGKTYHQGGEIELCRNGIHFCKNLKDVFQYYPDGRYCEVEASGTILTDEDKFVTSDITIIRELDTIEVNRLCYGFGYGDGDGYGNSNGYAYCYGNSRGDGYGDGYSYGSDNGNGFGYGDGNGYGNGNGYAYCYGNSRGDGYGYSYCSGVIERILIFTEV